MQYIRRRTWVAWIGAAALGNCALTSGPRCVASQPLLQWPTLLGRSPWIFLGDSNTYSGRYVAEIDARLRTVLGAPQAPKVLNLGMSSETASGLSEADHPFKRPCVHERLDKVLRMTQPGMVFVCYGMNDGIYGPPSPDVMAAYRQGMLRLAEAVRASGATLICLTPPPFEPEPLARKGRLGPSPQGRYAYFAPYPEYDLVLEEQSDWCRTNAMQAAAIIDVHRLLHDARRRLQASDPDFSFTQDGVHFGPAAHQEVALGILRGLGAPVDLVEASISDEAITAAIQRMKLLRDAYLTATGKNRPGLPAGLPVWLAEKKAAALR